MTRKKKTGRTTEPGELREFWREPARRWYGESIRDGLMDLASDWNDPEGIIRRQLEQDLADADLVATEAAERAKTDRRHRETWARVTDYAGQLRDRARAVGRNMDRKEWAYAMIRYRQADRLRWQMTLTTRELDAATGRQTRAGRRTGGQTRQAARKAASDERTRQIDEAWQLREDAGTDPRSIAGILAGVYGLHPNTIRTHRKLARAKASGG